MRPGVWAPEADHVDLLIGEGRRIAMRGDHVRGWWTVDLMLQPGVDYRFSLDGGPPRIDPRSHWQPQGLLGASRVVDHGAFEWTDTVWRGADLRGAVIAEMHIGTCSAPVPPHGVGTFDGAIGHLTSLVDLGVTHVELMPVAEFPGVRGWGYDGVALYAVHHGYGGPEGFKRFVDAAHGLGLAVILDVVANHFGPQDCYVHEFGPYLHRGGEGGQVDERHSTPWGPAVNFDGPGSGAVRAFVVGLAEHWCERYHVDALRLDATHALVDDSPVHILAEMAAAIDAVSERTGIPRAVFAEHETLEPLVVTARSDGGWGLTGQWADDYHHALHAVLTGERDSYYAPFGRRDQIAAAIDDVAVVGDHIDRTTPRRSFVVCSQNHDQVGNRAMGDRLVHQVGAAKAKLAAALTLLHPGTPLLFQGEWWGASSPFPFFADLRGDLAEAVREGRRREFEAFGWLPEAIGDPVDRETFASAVLRWDEADAGLHREMLEWHRLLIATRRAWPDFTDDRPEATGASCDGTLLRMRRGRFKVCANLGDEPVDVTSEATAPVLLATAAFGAARGMLEPWGVAVFGPVDDTEIAGDLASVADARTVADPRTVAA
jgi:maltooligosyltrehalose trehalohydrolase